VLNALANPACRGVVFEIAPGGPLHRNILDGISAVCRAGKDCFMLLPAQAGGPNYTQAISTTVNQLKRSPYYSRLHLVLACYNRYETQVGFLGGLNSVEGALNWCKRSA